MSTLKLLEIEDLADLMLFFLGSRVLDPKTRQLFEADVCQSTIPNFDTLVTFVQKRVKILENVQGVDKTETRSNKFQKSIAPNLSFTAASNAVHKTKGVSSYSSKSNKAKHCTICNRGEHFLYHCPEFKTYSVPRRREYVRTNKLCFSCLSSTHMVDNCKSRYFVKNVNNVITLWYTFHHNQNRPPPLRNSSQSMVERAEASILSFRACHRRPLRCYWVQPLFEF